MHPDGSPASGLFSFLGPENPLHGEVAAFLDRMHAHPRFRGVERAALRHCRRKLRGKRGADGTWKLRSVYASFALEDPDLPAVARYITFRLRGGRQVLECFNLREDPEIPAASAALAEFPSARVLRYVPRRRLTVRIDADDRIGKVLPAGEAASALARLEALHAARAAAGRGPLIAAPAGLAAGGAAYLQDALPGRGVTELMAEGDPIGYISRVAAELAGLHRLSPAGIPDWRPDDDAAAAESDLAWCALFLPDSAPLFDRVASALRDSSGRAARAPERCLCHGDFGLPQVLADGGHWAFVDFDNCVMADPMLDLGAFRARLEHSRSLAALRERVALPAGGLLSDAAVGGYRMAGGTTDGFRMDCHELRAHGRLLAESISADAFDAAGLAAVLRRMDALGRLLATSL